MIGKTAMLLRRQLAEPLFDFEFDSQPAGPVERRFEGDFRADRHGVAQDFVSVDAQGDDSVAAIGKRFFIRAEIVDTECELHGFAHDAIARRVDHRDLAVDLAGSSRGQNVHRRVERKVGGARRVARLSVRDDEDAAKAAARRFGNRTAQRFDEARFLIAGDA
ncbi:MAG: hypothetical protein R3C55_08255 [Parvularculaceae bacterium]